MVLRENSETQSLRLKYNMEAKKSKNKTSDNNTNLKPMFERHTTQFIL